MTVREWMREHDDPTHPLIVGPPAAIAMTILLTVSMVVGLGFIVLLVWKGL